MTQPVHLAHFSDTHVGFTQYPKRTPSGRPVREQDTVRAFQQTVSAIDEWDPPLVIHSGDFYDRPVVSLRHQVQGQAALQQLSTRHDGTVRAVVVISGNHDQPSDPREPCALELDTPITGVHIVTSRYEQIDLGIAHQNGLAPAEVSNVIVHCIPHDVLRDLDFDLVQPVPGRINILTCHGVVGGSDLYKRTIGREYALPISVVERGWDYVAMGHWHKRGPVAVGGYSKATSPIWYAGSTENNGFSDAHGSTGAEGRGYLQVQVNAGQVPQVKGVDLPVRAMFRLLEVDAAQLSSTDLQDILTSRISESDVSGAVVSQPVINVNRDVWNLIDQAALRKQASDAVWYECKPKFAEDTIASADSDGTPTASDAYGALKSLASDMLKDDPAKDQVIELSTKLLKAALGGTPGGEEETADDNSTIESTGDADGADSSDSEAPEPQAQASLTRSNDSKEHTHA